MMSVSVSSSCHMCTPAPHTCTRRGGERGGGRGGESKRDDDDGGYALRREGEREGSDKEREREREREMGRVEKDLLLT